MKKKIVIWIVAVSVFLIITAGLLCWAAYANQPTFCGLTRSELENYNLYFGETLITDPEVKDQVITCCLNMDFFRQKVGLYETILGEQWKGYDLTFQKGDLTIFRYRIFFIDAEEQLALNYAHRDQPVVSVAYQEDRWLDDQGVYEYVQPYVHYYSVSPEDYSMLLNLMTSSWDNLI